MLLILHSSCCCRAVAVAENAAAGPAPNAVAPSVALSAFATAFALAAASAATTAAARPAATARKETAVVAHDASLAGVAAAAIESPAVEAVPTRAAAANR